MINELEVQLDDFISADCKEFGSGFGFEVLMGGFREVYELKAQLDTFKSI